MPQKEVLMTYEGLKKLEEELEYLKTTKRKEISERIKVALGYGDLSENSEYDEAKDEQARVEAKIAEMENDLDKIEAGQRDWLRVLHQFYDTFRADLKKAEEETEGQKIKVPEEFTGENCPECGKPLVYKTGKFGKFIACSGFPDCKYTRKIIVYAPGKCPKCGGRILKLNSKRGRTFYACENGPKCDFMSWEVPTEQVCPVCGSTMFKKNGKNAQPHCIKEGCSNASLAAPVTRGRKKKTEN